MSLVIKLKPARAAAGLLELQKTNWCRRKKRLPKSPGLRKRKSPRGAAPQAAEGVGRRTHEVYEQGRSTGVRMSDSIQRGYRSGEQLEIAMQMPR